MTQDARGKFSIVIPTLQRSAELGPLVAQLAEHPLVHEVLVINNAATPLVWESPRVRVLQQEENIYVNPAWNLGAAVALGEFIAIVNDDITMPDDFLDCVWSLLKKPWVGLVGADVTIAGKRRVRIATEAHIPLGYGVFMAMRRKDYLPIPADLKIWGGDNLLFWTSRRIPMVVLGSGIATEMGTTSGSREFSAMRVNELHMANAYIGPWLNRRWWHRPVRALDSFRSARGHQRATSDSVA